MVDLLIKCLYGLSHEVLRFFSFSSSRVSGGRTDTPTLHTLMLMLLNVIGWASSRQNYHGTNKRGPPYINPKLFLLGGGRHEDMCFMQLIEISYNFFPQRTISLITTRRTD